MLLHPSCSQIGYFAFSHSPDPMKIIGAYGREENESRNNALIVLQPQYFIAEHAQSCCTEGNKNIGVDEKVYGLLHDQSISRAVMAVDMPREIELSSRDFKYLFFLASLKYPCW